MMKITGLVFGLFLIWIPKISAQSSCCETIKEELEQKLESYQNLCPRECEGYALRFDGDTSDYVISNDDRDSPMAATTACSWVKTNDTTVQGCVVSYAIPTDDNVLVLYLAKPTVRLFIRRRISSDHDITVNDGNWHHVCATWKSEGGIYEIYKDGRLAGSGSITDTIGQTLSEGGAWVLGQEQDTVGGGFFGPEAFIGEMTETNIWDRVLSAQEILEMSRSCKSIGEGNVKSWDDFESGVRGNVEKINPTCCSAYDIL